MKINFGVDSFIWTENFSEKDLWIIKKADELGFETIDFAAIVSEFSTPSFDEFDTYANPNIKRIIRDR